MFLLLLLLALTIQTFHWYWQKLWLKPNANSLLVISWAWTNVAKSEYDIEAFVNIL
jgi:hypothetical protein